MGRSLRGGPLRKQDLGWGQRSLVAYPVSDPSSSFLADLIPPQTAPARTKRLLSQSPLQLGVTDETCDVFWWGCLESSINVGVGRQLGGATLDLPPSFCLLPGARRDGGGSSSHLVYEGPWRLEASAGYPVTLWYHHTSPDHLFSHFFHAKEKNLLICLNYCFCFCWDGGAAGITLAKEG